MKSDRANVCTLVSALINSQPLSALPRLHFEIPNRVTALPCLHLKIANQELESPAVCTFASAKKRYTVLPYKFWGPNCLPSPVWTAPTFQVRNVVFFLFGSVICIFSDDFFRVPYMQR